MYFNNPPDCLLLSPPYIYLQVARQNTGDEVFSTGVIYGDSRLQRASALDCEAVMP